jgi:hypothetical protein
MIDKKLRLSGLEFLTELNGKTFDEISRRYQRRIREYTINFYKVHSGTPTQVVYNIFQRINTTGITLNKQEIRNAMVKPQEREILQELAEHSMMTKMMGDLSTRMIDQELILRFWAFYHFDYFDKANKKAIAPFLDRAMEQIKSATVEEVQELRLAFSTAIHRCNELLGDNAFVKDITSPNKRKNAPLFETLMVNLAKLQQGDFELLLVRREQVIAAMKSLLVDEAFFGAITYSTQKEAHVRIRHNKVNELIKGVLNA